jgi:acetoin utilization deacetylase AcuC-like enzyme
VERYKSVVEAVEGPKFEGLQRRSAPAATVDQLALVHDRNHVEWVLAQMPERGQAHLDPDTVVSPGSGEAAIRAVGAVCAAVDAVIEGGAQSVFCGVRPPGHHAEPQRSMGFCLFNNIAVGAFHAREAHGVERIAVVDFDVHHGNGTQVIFENDPDLFYGSTHQYPFYPGTGANTETGVDHNVVNLPLAAHSGSKEFREAVDEALVPELEAFGPDLVLVSAGFDAHEDDPLGQLRLTDDDFAHVTCQLQDVADRFAGGRIVSSLEGGYDLAALSRCVGEHVLSLMEQ